MRKVFLFAGLLFIALHGFALEKLSDQATGALFNQEIGKLRFIYDHASDSQKRLIEKALYGSLMDLDNLEYEQIRAGITASNDDFNKILNRHLAVKEIGITKEVSKLTSEGLKEYLLKYPKREGVITSYLYDVIFNNLDSITYRELDYLNRTLSYQAIKDNISIRTGERAGMVRSSAAKYCELEQQHTQLLSTLLKMAAWQYFNSQYQTVAKAYSNIGIVPDSQSDIDRQFRSIVNSCLKAGEFKKQLNVVVDMYCRHINNSRLAYADEAKISNYPLMQLNVPDIKDFSFSSSPAILAKIPKARKDFVDSRETAGTIASIANIFLPSIVTNIGKGLYDMYAVGELADSEVAARKELMQDAYDQLSNKIDNYCNNIFSNITNQARANNKKFIEYVANYK